MELNRLRESKIELTCLRHGETDYNAKGIVQGWSGAKLSKLGVKQAEDYASKLSQPPEVIFCSDLIRCRQTLEIVRNKFPSVPVIFDQRIRERYFGKLENTISSLTDWKKFYDIPKNESFKGAETDEHFIERVRSFLSYIVQQKYKRILVVTHGGVISRIEYILEKPVIRHQNAMDYKFLISRKDKRISQQQIEERPSV